MPRFPKKEADIVALAERLWSGLFSNRLVYPQPPIRPISLRGKAIMYMNARNVLITAKAKAEQANADKGEALEELVDAMKSNIRYAEHTVDPDDDKLKLLGWAGKKTATILAPPGQVRLLESPKQGAGWLFLDWKAPADGGRPKVYKIQRRKRPEGPWSDVATAILTEATLVEQPEKVELECRVVAVNRTGRGEPSNTVMAVL